MRAGAVVLAALLGLSSVARAEAPFWAIVKIATRCLKDKDYDGALDAAQRAYALAPEQAPVRYLRGAALLGKKEYAAASVAFREALALNPNLAGVRGPLASSLLQIGDLDGAIDMGKQAVREPTAEDDDFVNLARAQEHKGDRAAALGTIEHALTVRPGSRTLRDEHIAALRRAGRKADAVAAARDWARLAPDDPHAHSSLSAALIDNGDRAGAASELHRATQLDPKRGRDWALLGGIELALDHPEPAIKALNSAIRLTAEPRLSVDLARAWLKKQNLERARDLLCDAIADHPDSRSLVAAYEAVRGTKDTTEAEQRLTALPAESALAAPDPQLGARCRARKARGTTPP